MFQRLLSQPTTNTEIMPLACDIACGVLPLSDRMHGAPFIVGGPPSEDQPDQELAPSRVLCDSSSVPPSITNASQWGGLGWRPKVGPHPTTLVKKVPPGGLMSTNPLKPSPVGGQESPVMTGPQLATQSG